MYGLHFWLWILWIIVLGCQLSNFPIRAVFYLPRFKSKIRNRNRWRLFLLKRLPDFLMADETWLCTISWPAHFASLLLLDHLRSVSRILHKFSMSKYQFKAANSAEMSTRRDAVHGVNESPAPFMAQFYSGWDHQRLNASSSNWK